MKPKIEQDVIVKTAAKLIRERGFASMSMRDLAEDLGIKAASIYNHVNSKNQILELIIMQLAKEFMQHINCLEKNEKAAVQLRKIIAHHIDLSIARPNSIAVLNNDWIHLDETSLREFKSMRNSYEEALRLIIENGIQQQEFKPIHSEIVLFSLLSTLRNLHLWIKKRGGIDKQTLIDDVTLIFLNGILAG